MDGRHFTTADWDFVCAAPIETQDVNTLVTEYEYDVFCRPTKVETPSHGFTITTYNNIGDPNAQYIETQTPEAVPSGGNLWSREYLDGFGRTWRTLARGPASGQDIRIDFTFNARGEVASETAPYYSNGTAPDPTIFAYDALDRRTKRTHPDDSFIQGSYGLGDGLAVEKLTITDELGRTTTTHTDAGACPRA